MYNSKNIKAIKEKLSEKIKKLIAEHQEELKNAIIKEIGVGDEISLINGGLFFNKKDGSEWNTSHNHWWKKNKDGFVRKDATESQKEFFDIIYTAYDNGLFHNLNIKKMKH